MSLNDTAYSRGTRDGRLGEGPHGAAIALPGSRHAAYLAGHAAGVRTQLGCTCPADARGPWDCTECRVHGRDAEAECEAQHREAERVLPSTEAPVDDDDADEQYEPGR